MNMQVYMALIKVVFSPSDSLFLRVYSTNCTVFCYSTIQTPLYMTSYSSLCLPGIAIRQSIYSCILDHLLRTICWIGSIVLVQS